jgi:hypothetical protein
VAADHTAARSAKEPIPAATFVKDAAARTTQPSVSVTLVGRRAEPVPTAVFDAYWRFAAQRQEIFFARLSGLCPPWTADPILQHHRFTNAYRVLDRVSQHLVREVLPAGSDDPNDVFVRVVLFKLFNKIETWQTLCDALGGTPSWATFDVPALDDALTRARARGARVYSAAYIMPAAAQFGAGPKHRGHLRLVEWMVNAGIPERIAAATTMADAFGILRDVPSFGGFLAYQLVTDLNYSDMCMFDEMEFVQPGPGARDGIAKCFESLGDYSEADVIRWVADTQQDQFAARGISFRDLWGRPLQLIDCQNLFCEIDKYARVAHPEITGRSGRTRIKQKFLARGPVPPPTLPPKWGIEVPAAPGALATT